MALPVVGFGDIVLRPCVDPVETGGGIRSGEQDASTADMSAEMIG